MRGPDLQRGADTPTIPGVDDLELIARGGAGLIYRGRQGAFGRDVAVKVLAAAPTTPESLHRWERELEAMGRLSNHPNIVAVYDSGLTADGRPYLVMPFVPGGSLGDLVRNAGPLAPDEAVSLGVKIASALAAAHEAGVLHRDVKPDNVLLSPYEPQLADFGIARLVDATTTAVTAAGQIHATINYAAPEVLAGEPASVASDVYGLGATLYTALRGEVPFPHRSDANAIAVAHQIIHEPVPSLGPDVPAAIGRVVEAAMAKDPSRRPNGAAAFADLLAAAGAPAGPADTAVTRRVTTARIPVAPSPPLPKPSRTPSVERRAPAPMRRRTPLFALLGGAAALLAVVLLVANASRDDTPNTPATTQTTEAVASTAASRATAGRTSTSAVEETGRRYFTRLSDGDYAGAYGMLSPGFRAVQSQADFERFWRSASPVSIAGPVTARGMTVTVPIRMGSRPDTYVLTLARGGGDTLYVDGPRPR